jgi:hypothetical protein
LQAFAQGKGSPGPGANPEPMSEPRAQRTLVKSPPELWAEISDVSTLARHLGAFGEIRITRLENETTVVWEGDRACGTVELEASGWGTKVTITAAAVAASAQEEPEPEPAAVAEVAVEEPESAEPEAEAEAVVEAESETVVEAEAEAVVEPQPEPEPEPEHPFAQVTESLAALELGSDLESAPKRGLFARLFRRRATPAPVGTVPTPDPAPPAGTVPTPDPEAEPVGTVPEPEVVEPVGTVPEPEAVEPVGTVPEPDPEPEAAAPQLDDDHVEAVLVGVLDDLGSAHHRPFSRG